MTTNKKKKTTRKVWAVLSTNKTLLHVTPNKTAAEHLALEVYQAAGPWKFKNKPLLLVPCTLTYEV